ncbi:MAG: hypothetical protein MUF54_18415, partial [Polyangiaceae bacterium]|nr:hypothetical protein [Polyangiaceae bacterium]
MWLWIAALLLVVAIWVGGWFLELRVVFQIALTVLVVLPAVGIVLFRRWRAMRAARALEKEILKQAAQQAATARPDRRAE